MKQYLRPAMWRFLAGLVRTWVTMRRRIARQPLAALLRDLDRGAREERGPLGPDDVRDAVHFLLYRARVPLPNTCLIRCLTVYSRMRAIGLPASIVFAVRPGQEIRDGHCWLELDGAPFLEPDERRHGFTPIFRHPDHGPPTHV